MADFGVRKKRFNEGFGVVQRNDGSVFNPVSREDLEKPESHISAHWPKYFACLGVLMMLHQTISSGNFSPMSLTYSVLGTLVLVPLMYFAAVKLKKDHDKKKHYHAYSANNPLAVYVGMLLGFLAFMVLYQVSVSEMLNWDWKQQIFGTQSIRDETPLAMEMFSFMGGGAMAVYGLFRIEEFLKKFKSNG